MVIALLEFNCLAFREVEIESAMNFLEIQKKNFNVRFYQNWNNKKLPKRTCGGGSLAILSNNAMSRN